MAGRLQVLDMAWDSETRRWFHLYPDEDVSPGNGLHWTGPYKNWQARCAVCHQTDFHKNYDPAARQYQSRWSELTIGCEACHGPGEAHVAWAQKTDAFDPAVFDSIDERGLVRPSGETRQAREENMCGPCHSRREQIGGSSPLPGAGFGDHYRLAPLSSRLYFPDGQQNEEVYVLGSFLQSKMHARGVTCTNCHEPHAGTLLASGNAVCTQCHNPLGRADFPTLKPKDYDSFAHHHHAERSDGAQCVNCHMPERKYMVIDGRRDHFFRVPDPLLSKKTGAPDACTGCHTGKTAEWAAEHIAQWAPARASPATAYAEAFAMARQNSDNRLTERARQALIAVAVDGAQPAIARATALAELADDEGAFKRVPVANLLSDPSDLIRSAAARMLRGAPPEDRVKLLVPILRDPVASVRIAAALELNNVPPADLPEDARNALSAALDEFRASLLAKADFPETQMAIGGLALSTRNWAAAEAAFAMASLMDPQLVEAWLVRARIREALGDPGEAIAILSKARASNGQNARIVADLAALLARQGRIDEAVPLLKERVQAEPDNLELRMMLASILIQSGKVAEGSGELDVLLKQAPDHPEVLILQALRQLMAGDVLGARETVRKITSLHPALPCHRNWKHYAK